MVVATVRPMVQERDTRRAMFEPWFCEGSLKEGSLKGRPCRKVLMDLDMSRPAAIRKTCERCGYQNLYVEAYRPA